MKKLGTMSVGIFVLVILALLVSQAPAFAGGDQVKRKDFALIGEVLSVDVPAGTLVVAPISGYGAGGAPTVTIFTTPETRFAPVGVSLETLAAGDEVRTSGRLVDGQMVAEVIVRAP